MLRGKYYADREVVKAALGDVQDDKQSPFPSVKNRKREKREGCIWARRRKVRSREKQKPSDRRNRRKGKVNGETRQNARKDALCDVIRMFN